MTRAARALVDISALRHNLQRVREAAPGRHIVAVIKADAYGHGALRVARAGIALRRGYLKRVQASYTQ